MNLVTWHEQRKGLKASSNSVWPVRGQELGESVTAEIGTLCNFPLLAHHSVTN